MHLTESRLRKLIQEIIIESTIIRRRSGEESRRESGFVRRNVTSISDVQYSGGEDAEPSSPFFASSDAYHKTYAHGQEYYKQTIKKKLPMGDKYFVIQAEAAPIKDDDIVIIPELFDAGKLGAGVILSSKLLNEEIPVANIRFMMPTGDTITFHDIGFAFLLRLGSSKSASGRQKYDDANAAMRNRPSLGDVSSDLPGEQQSQIRRNSSVDNSFRDQLGLRHQ